MMIRRHFTCFQLNRYLSHGIHFQQFRLKYPIQLHIQQFYPMPFSIQVLIVTDRILNWIVPGNQQFFKQRGNQGINTAQSRI